MMSEFPKLVVFDLDFTLWDCGGTYCDCLSPPFALRLGRVVDRRGLHVRLYNDVAAILEACDQVGASIALASRTEQPAWARQLIDLLGLTDRIAFAEIYPSSKLKHFASLQAASDLEYEEMLFFDDERRNIVEVETLGVTAIHVHDGMTTDVFQVGLDRWRDRGE
ncbi:MAG: magnesium-dependent phosphatase-1 [Planctomycetota bacterium]